MSNRKIFFGIVLVVIGLVLLGKTFDVFYFTFGDLLGFIFPVALISIGIWLMAKRRGQVQAAEVGAPQQPGGTPPAPPPVGVTPDETRRAPYDSVPPHRPSQEGARVSAAPEAGPTGKLKYSKFIGDMYVDCNGKQLQNVEIGNFLGDVEVKLHGGKLSPGLNRMIVSGFIGDVRVLIPEGMAVFAQSSNFIGDIEMMGQRSAGFGNSLDAQTPDYAQAEAKLYIASNHFIGDVRIYVV